MEATQQIRIKDRDDTGGGETRGESGGNAIPNALTRGAGRGIAGMFTIGAGLPVHSILCGHPRCGWGDAARQLPVIGPRLDAALRPSPATTSGR